MRTIDCGKVRVVVAAEPVFSESQLARALIAAERMGELGYDEGRPTAEPGVRYRPPYRRGERLGLYYTVTPAALRVIWVVDARTLRSIP